MEKQLYSAGWERIREGFLADNNAAAALDRRTRLVDDEVVAKWPDLEGIALLAVGGYGRRELFPFSDVDILILTSTEKQQTECKEPISAFLRELWDAGLRVSQSVHTVKECAGIDEHNIELAISLLDRRLLAGDSGLYGKLDESLGRMLHAKRDELNRHLAKMTRERHAKFQNTIYHLEPNIKESPGGLRDFQVIRWTGQIMGKPETGARVLPAADVLSALRCHLHYSAGRDANALTFDLQDQIAAHLHLEPAVVMRDFFRNAAVLERRCLALLDASEAAGSSLFAAMRDRRSRFSNADFTISRGAVLFRSPQQSHDPGLVLRLFMFIARHGIRLAPDARDRLTSHSASLAAYFSEPRFIWPELKEILSLPHSALALREMHETGVLRAIFPELEEIQSLVVRDFYHRYTVDEHTLVAIQTIVQLAGKQGQSFADILSEIDDVPLLLIALLFHDAGKGAPGEGHVGASARIAGEALNRIGMPQRELRDVTFLIEAHLEMSSVMNSRDLSERSTAEDMAHRVGTAERLRYLTLLTYADISAVNPAAMTPWRETLLWRLYSATYAELTRELESERIHTSAGDPPERRQFLEGLPARYLQTHADAEIEKHMGMERDSLAQEVATSLIKTGAVYELTVVTRDRPFLFASVAGVISSFGLNILKAEAYSNERRTVVDVFTFEDPLRSLELNPSERDQVESVVRRAAMGKVDVPQLLRRRPKPPSPGRRNQVGAKVWFDNEASRTATLIQLIGLDRPGLLYDVASAISSQRCSIEVVLIDTEAHKAIDVFYVTANGEKLDDGTAESAVGAIRKVCG